MGQTLGERARERDQRVNAGMRHSRGMGMHRRVDQAEVMRMVDRYGLDVLTNEGEGFWQDMERREPHICIDESRRYRPPRGRMTRWGRSKERYSYVDGSRHRVF